MILRLGSASIVNALLMSALWLGSEAAYAQSNQPGSFVADEKSGCKVWNPHPEGSETVIWSGYCLNGLAQGTGSLEWMQNGKPYETDRGEWKEGRQVGRGSQNWTTGRYEGELLSGEPQRPGNPDVANGAL